MTSGVEGLGHLSWPQGRWTRYLGALHPTRTTVLWRPMLQPSGLQHISLTVGYSHVCMGTTEMPYCAGEQRSRMQMFSLQGQACKAKVQEGPHTCKGV